VISDAAVIELAAALYLIDCVVLLERGQALLEARWAPLFPRMALAFGSLHYQISGKAVAFLNPLTPFIPAIRTLPLFSASSGPRASVELHAVMPLVVPAFMQLVLVFIAVPVCLYRAPGWPFLVSLLLAYLNAIAMLGILWWRFRKAGIARRPLVALGFGWLVCLPLSVNCLRKAGIASGIAIDARSALRFLSGNERQRAREALKAQIAEAMHELDENDHLHRRLAELRQQLTPEADSGRA
jgi:hypothetical protein